MRCTNCGSDNPESGQRCIRCSAALVLECPACGRYNLPKALTCRVCGKSLTTAGPPPARSLPASFVRERYRVLRLLGEGSSKRVYLAHDETLDYDVAFAVIKVQGLDEVSRARVTREARAMVRLRDNAHIVTFYHADEDNGQPYIISEYMEGGSVDELLKKAPEHRLPLAEAVRIAEEVCEGLAYAHSLGIVHRDLSPANIYLAQDGSAKLGDFGLAIGNDLARVTIEQLRESGIAYLPPEQALGLMIGTPAYMPPEQVLGKPSDARSDLYSLGATLYHMLTGRPPFVGDSLGAILSQQISAPAAPASKLAPGIPGSLDILILRLLAKPPEARPQTAKEVAAELRALIDDPRSSIDSLAESVMAERPNLGTYAGSEGIITILFTDIEGYTAMTARQGDFRSHEILRAHNNLVHKAVAAWGGSVVKSTGDGFMIIFPSAVRALHCTIELQRSLAAYWHQNADQKMRIRAGLDAGEPVREEADFYGGAVNMAARIAAAAKGGEILVSATIKGIAEYSREFRFENSREVELKGLGRHSVWPVWWSPSTAGTAVLPKPSLEKGQKGFWLMAIDKSSREKMALWFIRCGSIALALFVLWDWLETSIYTFAQLAGRATGEALLLCLAYGIYRKSRACSVICAALFALGLALEHVGAWTREALFGFAAVLGVIGTFTSHACTAQAARPGAATAVLPRSSAENRTKRLWIPPVSASVLAAGFIGLSLLSLYFLFYPTRRPTSSGVSNSSVMRAPAVSPVEVLFADNFEHFDPSWGAPSEWGWAEQGRFVLKPYPSGGTAQMNVKYSYSDVDVAADVEHSSESDRERVAGIIFWGKNGSDFYVDVYSANGFFKIGRVQGATWSDVLPWRPTSSIRKGNDVWNRIEIVTHGNRAALLINGTEIARFIGEPPEGGGLIGLWVGSEAYFSKLEVKAPAGLASKPAVGPSEVVFIDKFLNLDPSWGTANDQAWVENGSFIIQPRKGYAALNFRDTTFNLDLDVSVNVSGLGEPNNGGAGGIAFWAKNPTQDLYVAVYQETGLFAVQRLTGGKWSTVLPWQVESTIKTGAQIWNRMRVVTHGDDATVYINDQQVGQFTGEAPADGGRFGLEAMQAEPYVSKWKFSKLEVKVAPPP